jgi:hypothetical protein
MLFLFDIIINKIASDMFYFSTRLIVPNVIQVCLNLSNVTGNFYRVIGALHKFDSFLSLVT